MIDNEFAIKILEQYREKPTLINEINTVEEAVWLDEALEMGIKALKQEPCEDCISRKAVLDYIDKMPSELTSDGRRMVRRRRLEEYISDTLPPVTPQPKTGHWMRMSDLSEQEDDRYKCSRCGNVVHHTNKMNLYTFNSWCGRCGSENGRK